MKKLWVTGASGFLGWHVCQAAQADWQVLGTYATKPIALPGVTTVQVDLCDRTALQSLFDTLQPDAVIHCAAASQPNWCELNPAESYAINVTASLDLAALCGDRQIPCVFTSSDQVFDGEHAPYAEDAPISPINRYGEQKILAEEGMRSRHPEMRICRMPLMFGVAPTANSFIQPFLATLRSRNVLKLFTDEFRTPTSAKTAAEGLLLALNHSYPLLHLGGLERLSRYEFGIVLARVAQLPLELIQPCQRADVPMAAARPQDVSLNSQLAYTLGYQPLSLKQELEYLRLID
jgi:dTDP-4-dehydrorhamnose reductase